MKDEKSWQSQFNQIVKGMTVFELYAAVSDIQSEIEERQSSERFDKDAQELVIAYMKFKSEHPDALLTFTGESVEGPYRVFIDRPKNYILTITGRER